MGLVLAALALTGCWKREAVWEVEHAQRRAVVRPGESEAERLYRHGRDCMDTLERDDCALDYFEQLIALGPDQRELLGDATFRLVELYRRHGEAERGMLLLRKFWELGMGMGSAGVVPYGVRFAPQTLTSMYMVDVERLSASRLYADLPQDARDAMFTCDEARREQLREQSEARRDTRREAELAAMSERDRAAKEASRARRRARFGEGREGEDEDEPDPVYSQGLCQVAAALGLPDTSGFLAFVGGSSHLDPTQSVAVIRVEALEEKLSAAVADGRLVLEPTPAIEGRDLDAMAARARDRLRLWTIVGADYEGAPVQLMSFDQDELTLAPAALVPGLLHARAHAQTRLSPALQALLGQVPADLAFMTVVTPEAMREVMAEAGALAKLLPSPQGLMMAAVVYDYAGLFVRVPTEDAVKGWLLLAIARRMIEGGGPEGGQEGESEGADAAFMANVDISQSPDGGALLLSNILTRAAVLRMMLG